jgi:hypothetical protein
MSQRKSDPIRFARESQVLAEVKDNRFYYEFS